MLRFYSSVFVSVIVFALADPSFASDQRSNNSLGRHGQSVVARERILSDSKPNKIATDVSEQELDKKGARASLAPSVPADKTAETRHGRGSVAREKINSAL